MIDRFVRKSAGALGLDRGYSAHSMRATSITTAIENGAGLRMCRRPPGAATRARQSCMIGEGTIPRKRRRFSRPVDLDSSPGRKQSQSARKITSARHAKPELSRTLMGSGQHYDRSRFCQDQ